MRVPGYLALFCIGLLLTACASSVTHLNNPNDPSSGSSLSAFKTLYDYHLIETETNQPITLSQLIEQLKQKDVIFIGEFHGNHASHLLEAQLQAALYQKHPNQILSLEQFNRDQQPILNRYLDSTIGEKTLIKEAPAWPNYAGSYRPLIEFAKQHFLPVIAANAPAQTVRCVGRQGKDYLDKLPPNERTLTAKNPFLTTPAYTEKFEQFLAEQMGTAMPDTHSNAHQDNRLLAQLLRDNTMAETINQALKQSPEAQVLHINGAFHSNEYLGTVAALKRLNPTLNIAVISPVRVMDPQAPAYQASDLALGDFIYLLQPQPEAYVQASKRQKAFKAMFKKAAQKPCL
ncbi:ChaN family lipoprotein [Hydrogenovibrio sp. 3SP14C1]|uniref:ChaN family lipoprotein n=1 Tax=Hydrogenovibrio sp. 3SP14C1 TaxID=3038774 RepID=UPI0024177071|nr:ChaN family lipoprotein [Hydrogenovibrio sp. 3SP14C1]MDG4811600.1 ChaN family lipoprotein [Hydrogenovibrio sp. 3SP14C1]